MEIENLVTERVRAFLGEKSSPPESILDATEAERINNFVTRLGKLRKLWGTTLYADNAFGVGRTRWLELFKYRWVQQQGKAIAFETAEDSGVFQKIGELALGESSRVVSDRWKDLLYLSNGSENRFIDLSTGVARFLRVGLIPPGGGALFGAGTYPDLDATIEVDGDSDLAIAVYRYTFTLWDDVRKVESLPYKSFVGEDGLWISPIAADFFPGINVTDTGRAVRIDPTSVLTFGGYDNERATHYIVYRQAQSDGTFKRVAAFAGSNTYITPIGQIFHDQVAEAHLGQVIDVSISPPPSGLYYRDGSVLGINPAPYGPRFVKQFRDQLWYFGVNFPGTENGYSVEEFTNIRFFSVNGIAYASDVGRFDYFLYSYEIDIASGQEDTGMEKFGNTLMFFKSKSVHYLDGTTPDNYAIRELDTSRGITVPSSLKVTTIGVIGLGEGGFTLFDGVAKGKLISEEIADEVAKINLTYSDQISAAFDPLEEKYECHVPIENSYNTRVFIYDCKSRCWNFSKKVGGAAGYGLSSARRTVGLLGDKQSGRLYEVMDRSVMTNNGETMHGSWASKNFDFGSPGELKGLQRVTITARAKKDFRLSIDVIPDGGEGDPVTINDCEPDVQTSDWAEDEDDEEGADWDEGIWRSSTIKKRFTILVQCIGETLQLIIRNSDTDADRANFEIEEILLEASLLGGSDDK